MTLGLITLGGTISMTSIAGGPARPTQSGSRLASRLGEAFGADLTVVDLQRIGSPQIRLPMVGELLEAADRLVAGGADGVVVTQGTDTLEETSFLADLVWEHDQPLVFTGAMRPSDAPGADGPANLRDALTLAGDPAAGGLGVLVCLGARIHSARRVRKTDANAPDAFRSPGWGALARIAENGVVGLPAPSGRAVLPRPSSWSGDLRIPVLWSALDDEGDAAALLAGVPADSPRAPRGVVVGTMGSGHLPVRMLEALSPLAARGVPVVSATRCGAGTTTSGAYGYPGSERDVLAHGLIAAGWLAPLQARLLLHVLLADGYGPDDIRREFAGRGARP